MKAIEYKGQRVITTKALADIYGAFEQQIQQNFKNHQRQFMESKHFFYLQGEELKEFKNHIDNIEVVNKKASHLYLWTERGANRHCKILDTDKAWEQFDNLEETYFRIKSGKQLPPKSSPATSLNGLANLINVTRKIMIAQRSSPYKIAAMAETLCYQFGVALPENFIEPSYEQIALQGKQSPVELLG